MPSKKRKYNARFPAGRIKKIMQQDEEVGKVAQAVPIIILSTPRTLELFVESLLSKAMQVTMQRNAKTLSPSHVKQCILGESRFDFLRDLVKNIPDVTIAEERELLSGESSPNSSRFSDTSAPRRVVREDSNSSSSSDVKVQQVIPVLRDKIVQRMTSETELKPKIEVLQPDLAIDLTLKNEEKPIVTANFYQETLTDEVQHRSVIKVNPTYSNPQPSTSSYVNLTPVESVHRVEFAVPKPEHPPMMFLDVRQTTPSPGTPVTPLFNIDFSKNFTNPEIKLLNTPVGDLMGVQKDTKIYRPISKTMPEIKKMVMKPVTTPLDLDHFKTGNLQIDEDYDT